MDISPAALVNIATQNSQTQLAQNVQIAVLKKALNAEATGALTLLQALPGQLPLATNGNVGTQVNVMA